MTLQSLDELLKRFDQNLFAKRGEDGVTRVYCNRDSFVKYELDGETLVAPVNQPYHVFSLTHNWGYWGKACDYGYMPLYQKLNSIRFENSERIMREMDQHNEKIRASKDRDLSNHTEAMAYEMRDVLKNETKDVLFHQMDAKKDKRFLNDKKLKGI